MRILKLMFLQKKLCRFALYLAYYLCWWAPLEGSGKYMLRHMPTNFIQTNFGNSNFRRWCMIKCCKIN